MRIFEPIGLLFYSKMALMIWFIDISH